jgi:hypothetical protein
MIERAASRAFGAMSAHDVILLECRSARHSASVGLRKIASAIASALSEDSCLGPILCQPPPFARGRRDRVAIFQRQRRSE